MQTFNFHVYSPYPLSLLCLGIKGTMNSDTQWSGYWVCIKQRALCQPRYYPEDSWARGQSRDTHSTQVGNSAPVWWCVTSQSPSLHWATPGHQEGVYLMNLLVSTHWCECVHSYCRHPQQINSFQTDRSRLYDKWPTTELPNLHHNDDRFRYQQLAIMLCYTIKGIERCVKVYSTKYQTICFNAINLSNSLTYTLIHD